VAARLRADGPNELPRATRRGIPAILRDVLTEPMIALLVAVGVVYLLLGEPREAAVLSASIVIVIAIELVQEGKTERTLEALRDLSSPRALVVRGGHHRHVAGREVVRDDVVIVAEGDRVPADGVLLWAQSLEVDESLLTGESVPVRKTSGPADATLERPARRPPSVASGARSRRSSRSRARSSARCDGSCGSSAVSRSWSARWRPWGTASATAAGSPACWSGSRSRSRWCPRSSRSS
jgi:Ca2+-transporting ATPase